MASGESDAPAGRQEESTKRKKTRGALIEAARTVFSEQGLSAASIEQVTQAAGFTRGAFYSNFDSKEALMLAVMDQERQQETARMAAEIAQITGDDGAEFTIDHLTAALVDVLLVGAPDRGWQLALMEALPVTLRDSGLAERQLEIRAHAEADARLLIEQGLTRLQRRPTIAIDLVALLVLGLVDRILTDTLLQGAPLDAFSRRAGSDVATLLLSVSRPEDATEASEG